MNNRDLYNKIMKVIEGDKNALQILEEIRKDLEAEILTGGKINNSLKQAFKRLLNENELRPRFQSVLRTPEKTYTILNGYFAITYEANKLPDELKVYIEGESNETTDLYYNHLKNMDELSLLSLNFEAMQKMYKYNKLHKLRNIFTLQNGYTFNLQYFMDIMALLNYKDISKMNLYVSESLYAPMNVESDNGDAILLPIRMTEEDITKQFELQNKVINEL